MAEIPELDLCLRIERSGMFWVPEDIANQAARTRQQQVDELFSKVRELERERDALAQWACEDCGCRFQNKPPDERLLDGVTLCTRCFELQEIERAVVRVAAANVGESGREAVGAYRAAVRLSLEIASIRGRDTGPVEQWQKEGTQP